MHTHMYMCVCVCIGQASLVAQLVKNLLAMQKTQVQTLGGEDALEKEMATPIPVFSSQIECPSPMPSLERCLGKWRLWTKGCIIRSAKRRAYKYKYYFGQV